MAQKPAQIFCVAFSRAGLKALNFLAHAYLGGSDQGLRVGGYIGDFIKGELTQSSLPVRVRYGVELHRRIDAFAETHPAFQKARARLPVEVRRVSGIMVDMVFDHFLARDWATHRQACHAEHLSDFTRQLYLETQAYAAYWTPEMSRVLTRIQGEDWLATYQNFDAISFALDQMGRHRLRRPNALTGSGQALWACYAALNADFEAFLPDAREFAQYQGRRLCEGLPDS